MTWLDKGESPPVGEDSEASPSDSRGPSGVSLSRGDTGIIGWAEHRGEVLTEEDRGRAKGTIRRVEGKQAGEDQRKKTGCLSIQSVLGGSSSWRCPWRL